jgi:hypothetical protein
MWDQHEDWLLRLVRRDSEFLRKMGIEACVIDDPSPVALPLPLAEARHVRLTRKDVQWLKACGVAWEAEAAFQLSLNLCGDQEGVP